MQSEWRYRIGICWAVGVVASAGVVACGTVDETLPSDSSGPDAAIVIPGVDAQRVDVEREADARSSDRGSDAGGEEQSEPGEWEGEGSVEQLPPPVTVDPPGPVDERLPWTPGACVDVEVLCTVRGLRALPGSEVSADVLSTVDCEATAPGVDLPDTGVEYVWSLNAPPASGSSFGTMAGPEVSLFLDAVGDYRILVEVMAEAQVLNCEPAFAQVVTQPGDDIYIEVTWTTPGDPERDDTGAGAGADVDLHMLQNFGGSCWGDIPEDCHWRNRTPDWGVVGVETDNCGLDLDDTDGWGPEAANLNRPQELVYSVGVHYWDDWGFGESTVHVNVYFFGSLVYEAERTITSEKEFWHVADIDWTTQSVIEVDALYPTMESATCGE